MNLFSLMVIHQSPLYNCDHQSPLYNCDHRSLLSIAINSSFFSSVNNFSAINLNYTIEDLYWKLDRFVGDLEEA
ncbi:hypothetical protein SOVF_091070 [Spinacia oleracea]|nr:hypothetical protein SOVF_091070 [Spinacia oleracea]